MQGCVARGIREGGTLPGGIPLKQTPDMRCVVVNDRLALTAPARAGLGLAYLTDREAAQAGKGKLEAVRSDWIPDTTGLFLYFPARTQDQPKLRALLEVLKTVRMQMPAF